MEHTDLLIDWSRAQFALTALYHWLFVPLTLGLTFIVAIMETIYVVENHYKILDGTFSDQLRHRSCNGYHYGI